MQRPVAEGLISFLAIFALLLILNIQFICIPKASEATFFLVSGEPDRHSDRVDQGSQHGKGARLGHHGLAQVLKCTFFVQCNL